jgi:CheY-like chemotaxis protein
MAHKQKILIVEDNADGRELFALYIRRLGYDVFEAATGLEALDQAHAVHPDLILMDLALPKMPGYEATALLKADPSTRDIPVIVNTACHKGPLSRALSPRAPRRYCTSLSV